MKYHISGDVWKLLQILLGVAMAWALFFGD